MGPEALGKLAAAARRYHDLAARWKALTGIDGREGWVRAKALGALHEQLEDAQDQLRDAAIEYGESVSGTPAGPGA